MIGFLAGFFIKKLILGQIISGVTTVITAIDAIDTISDIVSADDVIDTVSSSANDSYLSNSSEVISDSHIGQGITFTGSIEDITEIKPHLNHFDYRLECATNHALSGDEVGARNWLGLVGESIANYDHEIKFHPGRDEIIDNNGNTLLDKFLEKRGELVDCYNKIAKMIGSANYGIYFYK